MSQILKSVDFTKTQKSRYLKNEALFFLQIKKFINYTSRATLWQKNSFVAEVTFNIKVKTGVRTPTSLKMVTPLSGTTSLPTSQTPPF